MCFLHSLQVHNQAARIIGRGYPIKSCFAPLSKHKPQHGIYSFIFYIYLYVYIYLYSVYFYKQISGWSVSQARRKAKATPTAALMHSWQLGIKGSVFGSPEIYPVINVKHTTSFQTDAQIQLKVLIRVRFLLKEHSDKFWDLKRSERFLYQIWRQRK